MKKLKCIGLNITCLPDSALTIMAAVELTAANDLETVYQNLNEGYPSDENTFDYSLTAFRATLKQLFNKAEAVYMTTQTRAADI